MSWISTQLSRRIMDDTKGSTDGWYCVWWKRIQAADCARLRACQKCPLAAADTNGARNMLSSGPPHLYHCQPTKCLPVDPHCLPSRDHQTLQQHQ